MTDKTSSKEEEQHEGVVPAVEKSNSGAKTKLAWYKLSGCGGAEVDKDGAVALLNECVEGEKDAEAMWMLGLCYEYGIGCEQDIKRAASLYKQSCDAGNMIGTLIFENGKEGCGVAKIRWPNLTEELKTTIGKVTQIVPDKITESIVLKSPFENCIVSFNNVKSFPDVELTIRGMKDPLHLHRRDLEMTSKMLEELLKKQNRSLHLEWPNKKTENDEKYCNVIIKWLRFCYGEEQTFNFDESPAALAVLLQLQLKTQEDFKSLIETFMLDVAKMNVKHGSKMLHDCAILYDECHTDSFSRIDKALAKCILTTENIRSNYGVEDCLVNLPAEYLDEVEYDEGHEKYSEFSIRARYVKFNDKLELEEKHKILSQYKNGEVKEVDAQDDKRVTPTYEKTLDRIENTLIEELSKALTELAMKNETIKKLNEILEKKDRLIEELTTKSQTTLMMPSRSDGLDLSYKARNLLIKLPELKTTPELEWKRRFGEDWEGFCELLMTNKINVKKISLKCL